jgi:hypothetical protein
MATINNSCGNYTLEVLETFWVGTPSYQSLQVRDYYTKYTNPQLCLYDYNYLEVFSNSSDAQDIDQYGWNLISGGNLYSPDYPYDVAIVTPYTSPVSIQYRAHNSCGWSGYMNNTLYAYNCGYYYSYSPNPVSDEITIEAIKATPSEESQSSQPIEEIAFEVALYNSNQQVISNTVSKNNKAKLNVKGFKKGTYFLHIIDGDQIIKEQIIID